jgi:hypothetical protein
MDDQALKCPTLAIASSPVRIFDLLYVLAKPIHVSIVFIYSHFQQKFGFFYKRTYIIRLQVKPS